MRAGIVRAGVAAALAVAVAGCGSSHRAAAPTAPTPAKRKPALHRIVLPLRLEERAGSPLAQPLQDAAAAAVGKAMLLLGGLDARDVSTDGVRTLSATRGRLPRALHDAAAVTLGGDVYLFGGGDGVRQLDDILRIDPRTGAVAPAGRLPAASSDLGAASIGGTAYVVGGFTGTRWLDTIVAWRPGGTAQVVARLPQAVRYAAVTAAGGKLVIAGGSLPEGTASRAVIAFDPATRALTRLGTLPAATTHAAAAGVGPIAYVIGGRGPTTGTPTDAILAVDTARRRVTSAGFLSSPRSDLAAVTIGSRIFVAGGRSAGGTVADVGRLVTTAAGKRLFAVDPQNVYAADTPSGLTGAARLALPRIYVPNSDSNTVDVIDPATYKVVDHFAVGQLPQHVVPAWDLKTLYVTNDLGNTLTPIDPRTGRHGAPIPVDDPYNMYFTPDGRYAMVMAERLAKIDFRDAHTFRLHHSLHVPCRGVDHIDFSADGAYALASCEFSGQLLKIDVAAERVVATLTLRSGAMPQDVKLSPDGKVFYVADMAANGVWEIDAMRLRVLRFFPTGRGAHGLYPSRDAKLLYITNRAEGSISLLDFATRKLVGKWHIPGGSPDMGNVSVDGKVLWLTGRWSAEVYAISTKDGHLLARIPVGRGPHGLCVWPQPGRYSLGHTGILR